jgi:hypothetical protein
MGLTRTQNAVLFAAPFAIALAITPCRRIGLFWFGLGGAPFLAALLGYNDAMTGNALVSVQSATEPRLLRALNLNTLRVTLRHIMGLYIWTSPVLLFGVAGAFLTALWRRQLDFCDWIMPITVIGFLLYGADAGNEYGPRYYFEAWAFAVFTVVKAIDPILFAASPGARATWVSSAVIASLVFELGYLPARFDREHRVVMERQDVYTQAKSAGLDNALVIVAQPTGIIRRMYPWDLVRNGLHVDEPKVMYVRDLGEKNKKLKSQFPGRRVYVYSNGRLQAAP